MADIERERQDAIDLAARRVENILASRLNAPTMPSRIVEAVISAVEPSITRGAVSLLDDLADVLAEVTRGELKSDSEAVRDVLRRATRHANGGNSA